jgi:xylose isomerase
VLWGGREGYETLLNTDFKRETDQLGRFLTLVAEHKHKIGFKGLLLLEPKPKEPTKHQYDYDSQSVHAFLQKHGLEKEYKVNIEQNHAILAGHTFQHEVQYAIDNGIFGSLDINRGDPLLGWDTDQFPNDVAESAIVLYTLLKSGGFTSGGMNFDAKIRRNSTDPEDLFYAHIGGMDAFARGLEIAYAIQQDGRLDAFVEDRYKGWKTEFGKHVLSGKGTLVDCEMYALANGEPARHSGRQEMLENLINEFI